MFSEQTPTTKNKRSRKEQEQENKRDRRQITTKHGEKKEKTSSDGGVERRIYAEKKRLSFVSPTHVARNQLPCGAGDNTATNIPLALAAFGHRRRSDCLLGRCGAFLRDLFHCSDRLLGFFRSRRLGLDQPRAPTAAVDVDGLF